ncbi:MAG TPA: hypothetical protein VL595_33630 [Pseudonocardia sp.]|nr:hypothetical protein [Pseudonocardia sp.]
MTAVDQSVSYKSSPLALALAALPEVWGTLLLEHEPDSYGRCQACRTSGTPGVQWPCTLRVAAEDARELALADSSQWAGSN